MNHNKTWQCGPHTERSSNSSSFKVKIKKDKKKEKQFSVIMQPTNDYYPQIDRLLEKRAATQSSRI